MRLRSSAIYYALFLSVILGLLLGGLVLFAGINKRFEAQINIQDKLIDNAYSGIEYGLTHFAELSSEPTIVDLFGNGLDSAAIQTKSWGAFNMVLSSAHHRSVIFSKSTFAGRTYSEASPNLFLADLGHPLSLSGESRLEGNCKLPKAGLKRAYIEGQNYQGEKLIYGHQSPSNRSLPPINEHFLHWNEDAEMEVLFWDQPDSVQVSFHEDGKHYLSDHYLSLSDNYLSGQVLIEAKDSIFVGAKSELSDVILKSNVVYIQTGFKGSIQVYASERIVLEEGVQLMYPSVVALVEEDFPIEKNREIVIGAESQVIGSVFAISNDHNFRLPVQIRVAKDAELHGLVYCAGRTELRGTVNGSLYTQKFFLETESSKHENHLLGGQIKDELPDGFVVVDLLENNQPLTKMKWIE